jgi:predicted dehydrogenase
MESYSAAAPLGVLVVGAGFIADHHIAALSGRSDAVLAGIVDVDPVRAAAAARSYGGVRWTSDLGEALAWPDVDACVVCTPNFTHTAIANRIAEAGKHLLIEKPLTTTVADALAVAAAFAGAGVVLMAAHTHRFYDYGRTVKRVLDEGTVGRPLATRITVPAGWIWPDWRAWMIDPQKSGGHALHNGVHLLDLVTWWHGVRPVFVYARGRKQTAAELDIYDYLEMTVSFEDGSSAVCEMSRGHRSGTVGQRDVLVIGTEGVLSIPWDADSSLLLSEHEDATVPAIGRNGFAVQLGAWIDAIGGAAPVMTPDAAVAAVVMSVAAERSIAIGEPVRIADILAEGVTV